jgi:hypothetical protein
LNLHLKDSRASERQHPAQDRRGPGIVPAVLTRKGIPRFPDFRPIGAPLNQGPVSRPWPNRETGSGNGDSLLVSLPNGESESGERELGTFGSASGSVCQCVVRMGGSSWTTVTPMIVA